jgi:hypothetical protein
MSEKDSNIWQSLVIAITVAVVSSGINYFIWQNQWQAQLNEKSFDNRKELLRDTTSICIKYQNLRKAAVAYDIAFKSMTRDIPKTQIEKLSKVEKELKILRPDDYAAYVETDRMFPQVQSQLVLVQLFFGPDTLKAVLNYQMAIAIMPDEYIKRYVKQGLQKTDIIKKTKSGDLYIAPELKQLLGIVEKEQNTALLNLLEAIKKEMGVRASSP